MHTINIEHECGCFKRSSLENHVAIDDKDDALMHSLDILNQMNNEFCGKHSFKLLEVGENFVIAKNESTSHGCCGGGCSHH